MSSRDVTRVLLALGLGLFVACSRERDEAIVQIDLRPTIRDLASDDLEVSERAQNRLLGIGTPAIPALAAALRRQPDEVRVGVIEVLIQMPENDATKLLVDALADPSVEVRADAADGLQNRQGPAIEPALLSALRDPNALVRQRAAVACRSACRSPGAVPALVQCALDDPEGAVGWMAAGTLSQLRAGPDEGLRRAVDTAVLTAAPPHLGDADAGRRARAAILLSAMDDERAVPVLEGLVTEPGDTLARWRIIYALGKAGGASAVSRLQGLLADAPLRAYAYDAIRRSAERGVPGAADILAGYEGPRPEGPLPPPPS